MKKMLLLCLVLAMSAATLFVGGGKASAVAGTPLGQGYFTGASNTGKGDFVLPNIGTTGYSIPMSVNTVAEFESFVEAQNSSKTTWNHIGGAFIIQTMRGPDAAGNWDHSSTVSSTDLTDWKNKINEFIASGGTINFDTTFSYTINSFNIHNHGVDNDPDDIVFYSDSNTVAHTIVFTDASGTVRYAIKHTCANPVGNLLGLRPTWVLTPTSAISTTTASPGATVKFTHTVKDNEVKASGFKYWTYRVDYNAAGTKISSNSIAALSNTTGSASVAANSSFSKVDNSVLPSSWTAGYKRCEFIRVSPFTGPATPSQPIRDSTAVCVTVTASGVKGNLTPKCDSATLGHVDATYSDTGGATTAYIMANGVKSSVQGGTSHTWSGITIPSGGSTTITLYVKDVGAGGSNTYVLVKSASLSNALCSSPSSGCLGQSLTPPVTVGEASPPAPSSGYTYTGSAPSGSSTQKNQQEATETTSGYSISYAHDQYSPPTTVGWLPSGEQASNSFTLDYTNYKAYPYDHHDTTVGYTEYYTEQQYYTSSTPDSVVNGVNYYNWHTGGSVPNKTSSGTVAGPTYNECYDRTFTAHDPTVSVQLNPDSEDPTQAVFQGQILVDFGFTNAAAPLRNPNQVTLDYQASYYTVTGTNFDPAVGTPLPISCGLPSSGTVTVMGNYTASSNESGTVNATCNASFIPPLSPGDRICVSYAFSPTGSTMTETGAITPTSAGNGLSVETHNCSGPLVNEPYVHEFGLDVSAGGSFANGVNDQCSTGSPSPGNVLGFLKTAAAQTRGSGSQYATMALGDIDTLTQNGGFASASLRTSLPTANTGLTFANTGPLGHLGVRHCIPDYFATKKVASSVSTNSIDIGSMNFGVVKDGSAKQQQWYTPTAPGLTIGNSQPGATITTGNRVAIYVSGDVFINDSITLNPTNWTSNTLVPTFYLIVKGNIYIGPNVSRLDGVYVAQPNGASGGNIYTCAQSVGSTFPSSAVFDGCKANQLVVNGAFIAKSVDLYRTYSSLRSSLGGERPNTPPGDCASNTSAGGRNDPNYDCAAEVFDFSPETYLGKPAFDPIGGGAQKYDFITSLSPVF